MNNFNSWCEALDLCQAVSTPLISRLRWGEGLEGNEGSSHHHSILCLPHWTPSWDLPLFFPFSWKFSLFDANDKSIAQTTLRSDLTVRVPLWWDYCYSPKSLNFLTLTYCNCLVMVLFIRSIITAPATTENSVKLDMLLKQDMSAPVSCIFVMY